MAPARQGDMRQKCAALVGESLRRQPDPQFIHEPLESLRRDRCAYPCYPGRLEHAAAIHHQCERRSRSGSHLADGTQRRDAACRNIAHERERQMQVCGNRSAAFGSRRDVARLRRQRSAHIRTGPRGEERPHQTIGNSGTRFESGRRARHRDILNPQPESRASRMTRRRWRAALRFEQGLVMCSRTGRLPPRPKRSHATGWLLGRKRCADSFPRRRRACARLRRQDSRATLLRVGQALLIEG